MSYSIFLLLESNRPKAKCFNGSTAYGNLTYPQAATLRIKQLRLITCHFWCLSPKLAIGHSFLTALPIFSPDQREHCHRYRKGAGQANPIEVLAVSVNTDKVGEKDPGKLERRNECVVLSDRQGVDVADAANGRGQTSQQHRPAELEHARLVVLRIAEGIGNEQRANKHHHYALEVVYLEGVGRFQLFS